MAPRILVVLTSQSTIPKSGKETGWYLPEFAHPWEVFHKAGASITVASPAGGQAPIDPGSVSFSESQNDSSSLEFYRNQSDLWKKTQRVGDLVDKVGEFDAIFYVGGHGPMFDLVTDPASLALIQSFASARKPVAAVCHGPVALLNATTPSGERLLRDATVTAFSNVEEEQVKMAELMPFLLESELKKISGLNFVKADQPWGEKVVVSKAYSLGGPVVTGQNPASAKGVAEALLKELGVNA